MSNVPKNPHASPNAPAGYQQTGSRPLASRSDRFLGALIDGLIMGVPAVVLGFIMGMILASTTDPNSLTGNLIFNLIGGAFGIAIFLAVNGFLLATRGQTFGKTIMKTQIVADDGSLMPFGQLILKRYLPFWILGMIPYLGLLNLANFLMIFRESHKCLHDDIAGTKVISLK